MKKISALLVFLMCCQAAFTQQVYFVYLQTEGGQPFFLKMNEEVRSSNSSGYLILSRLRDSFYTFSIGFPQNKWPEQTYTVAIAGRDKGFVLKKEDDNNWALIDLQTEQRIAGGTSSGRRQVRTEPKEVSAFTNILSKATDDPSLKERVIPVEKPQPAVPEQKKEAAVAAAPVKADASVTSGENGQTIIAADSVAVAVAPAAVQEKKTEIIDITAKDTLVRRPADAPVTVKAVPAAENKVDSAVDRKAEPVAVQVPDTSSTQTAAVTKKEEPITVPVEAKKTEAIMQKEPDSSLTAVAPVKKEEPAPVVAEVKKEEPVPAALQEYKASSVKRRTESSTSEGFGITYIDEYPDGKKDTIQIFIPNQKSVARDVPAAMEDGQFLPMDSEAKDLTPVKKEKTGKSDCNSMASETDYLKLRKKMVATDGDDAMLAAAKKVFKTKCFTTEQLKNLGTLFLNDAGRYNFFDAAYLSVADAGNFSSLEAERPLLSQPFQGDAALNAAQIASLCPVIFWNWLIKARSIVAFNRKKMQTAYRRK
jgi:hypothetical protein